MRAWRSAALGAVLLLAPVPAPAQLAPGDVLVTSLAAGRVYRLDPSSPVPVAPVPVPTGGAFISPRGLAVDRNGLLLVADDGPKTISRVDPGSNTRAVAAQLSVVSSALRGMVALPDGRLFLADPGVVPLTQPPTLPVRGVTFFPGVTAVAVFGGVPLSLRVAGCLPFIPGEDIGCGNVFLPTGVAIASEEPEVVLLVADGGRPPPAPPPPPAPAPPPPQGVLRVFPERPFEPGVNDQKFCVPGPFAFPRSLAIDPSDGSVLVTDSGDATVTPRIPPRVFRVGAGGCDDAGDPPVEVVAEGAPLSRPVGIAVAADGTIYVADNLADTVFRIPDSVAGPETPVALSTPGSVDAAWDLKLYDADPGAFYAADAGGPELLLIDPAGPSRSTIASGPPLVGPAALEVLPALGGLLVADPPARAVNLTTLAGVQSLASQGGRLAFPTSVSREAGGTLLVTDLGDAAVVPPLAPAVIRVDPSQPSPANQTIVSEGQKLVRPVAGAIDADGYLIVADAGSPGATPAIPPRILRITPDPDPPEGAGQIALYQGPPLVAPTALALDDGGSVILVADAGDATNAPALRRLVRSGLPPGGVILVVNVGSGGQLETPAGVGVDTDGSILVTDGGDPALGDDGAVLRLDALSGLQTPVATAGTLFEPTGIGVDAPAPGAFVDVDGDGAADGFDNCVVRANPDQRDTNFDGFGNVCDADYDNDGVVATSDYLLLGKAFHSNDDDPSPSRYHPDLDADGDGAIGNVEYLLLGRCFRKAPGESGVVPPPPPPDPPAPPGPSPCEPAGP